MRMREKGEAVYKAYRVLTFTLSPLIELHLQWRRFRGLEHSLRWPERLGRPSLPRPPGRLLWFHAVSLGEGMAAIPVIRRCLIERPDFNILMTSTTLSAFEVLKNELPPAVIYQLVPHASLRHWMFLLLLMLSLATGNQMLSFFWKVNCGQTL